MLARVPVREPPCSCKLSLLSSREEPCLSLVDENEEVGEFIQIYFVDPARKHFRRVPRILLGANDSS
jgi:hypothetical protein